jgi:hypothetical protein
MIMHSDCA